MIIRRLSVLAVLVGTGLLVSGCGGQPAPAEPTPLFATEEEAFAAAERTYRDYVDALNAVDLSDPATFEPVFALTTGDLNATDRKGLTAYYADDVTITGHSRIPVIEPAAFDIGAGSVSLAVCLDVSDVDLIDREGNSIVDPARVDVQSLSVTLKVASDPVEGLLLSDISARDGAPTC